MSGEQNPVSKGTDDANNSAKSDTEAKTNVMSVAAGAEGRVVVVGKDNVDALSADATDPGAIGQQNKEIDNSEKNTDIADDPNNAAKTKTKTKTIIRKDGAALTEGTVESDKDIGVAQSADAQAQDPGASHQQNKEIDNMVENIHIDDDSNNATKLKDGSTVTEDTVEIDKDIGGPQSADIVNQDQFVLLNTMEQLEIAEAGKDPLIEPNSEVSTFLLLYSIFSTVNQIRVLIVFL